jgi:hypothetical protein
LLEVGGFTKESRRFSIKVNRNHNLSIAQFKLNSLLAGMDETSTEKRQLRIAFGWSKVRPERCRPDRSEEYDSILVCHDVLKFALLG